MVYVDFPFYSNDRDKPKEEDEKIYIILKISGENTSSLIFG